MNVIANGCQRQPIGKLETCSSLMLKIYRLIASEFGQPGHRDIWYFSQILITFERDIYSALLIYQIRFHSIGCLPDNRV